jgi:hypothetical protein
LRWSVVPPCGRLRRRLSSPTEFRGSASLRSTRVRSHRRGLSRSSKACVTSVMWTGRTSPSTTYPPTAMASAFRLSRLIAFDCRRISSSQPLLQLLKRRRTQLVLSLSSCIHWAIRWGPGSLRPSPTWGQCDWVNIHGFRAAMPAKPRFISGRDRLADRRRDPH